ncbi:MAG TPA: EAL domain-containing protein [Trichocoleus sp.]
MTKVLVIEDEAAIRANIADILELEGFEVLEAANGALGLQMAKKLLPDLILCDVMMPEMDGYEVVKAIRNHPETSTIPLIFLTARASKADYRQGMVSGSDDYLTKPFTASELIEAVDSQLAKQAAIAEKHHLEIKQLEVGLNRAFCYDKTTGLANQFLLRDQFRQVLATSNSSQEIAAILCIQLHHFERLIATLEPSLFDRLLQLLAERLKSNLGSNDTIARVKENQFISILAGHESREEVAQTAQNILNFLTQPFEIAGQRIYLSVSIGISRYPQNGIQIETLVKNAEISANAIFQREINSYRFYTDEIRARLLEQLLMENELRTAWENGNFQVFYQPQVNTHTRKIIGSEALLRCLHPQKGLLPPARFISQAEETGLIVPIGEWVTRTACRQAQAWQVQGYSDFRIAVNLSPRQFNQPNLGEAMKQLLEETGISPESLELEITESCVMEDLSTAIPTLKSFKDQGIRVALDDFGTGYSSLSYLKKIPLDTLKIDRAFISDIQSDLQNREIVKNIIQMAHGLGLKTLAEGMEVEAEMDCLRQLQCDELQGYLFSRPIPGQEFENFLKTWKG